MTVELISPTRTVAAKAATDAGLITICAFPSPKKADRAQVAERIGADRVIQVFVDTDEALCRERRPKADFSGFERPEAADVTVGLDKIRIDAAVDLILKKIEEREED